MSDRHERKYFFSVMGSPLSTLGGERVLCATGMNADAFFRDGAVSALQTQCPYLWEADTNIVISFHVLSVKFDVI